LDIGAYYTDTGWQYETTKYVRTAAGVKWTSGSVDATARLVGFRINHNITYSGAWPLLNGGGATDWIKWTNCTVFKAGTNRGDINLINTNLVCTIRGLTIDGRAGFGDNHVLTLSSASDVDGINFYYANLNITAITNLKNNAYTFQSNAGTFNDRFVLVYSRKKEREDKLFSESSIVLYKPDTDLHVDAGTTIIKELKVYDLKGRLLLEKNNINATTTSITMEGTKQVLIVEITTRDGIVISKKYIN
jgi:hypothetical protein